MILSQASTTILKSIESLYKQTLQTFDRTTNSFHHFKVVQTYHLLRFHYIEHFVDACLIFKL